ncbi:hypothetical protein MIR68_009224, partial [Amoeboaphelidium protococcarum]
ERLQAPEFFDGHRKSITQLVSPPNSAQQVQQHQLAQRQEMQYGVPLKRQSIHIQTTSSVNDGIDHASKKLRLSPLNEQNFEVLRQQSKNQQQQQMSPVKEYDEQLQQHLQSQQMEQQNNASIKLAPLKNLSPEGQPADMQQQNVMERENLNLEDYVQSWQIVLIVLLSLANLLQSISHLPQLIVNLKSKSSQALSDGFLFFGLIHGISLCCWQGLRSGFNIYLLAPIIYTFFAGALASQRIYHQFPSVPSLKSKSNGKLFNSLAAEQLVQVVPKYVMQYFALIIACYSALILRLDVYQVIWTRIERVEDDLHSDIRIKFTIAGSSHSSHVTATFNALHHMLGLIQFESAPAFAIIYHYSALTPYC